jgi:hypothetical protein
MEPKNPQYARTNGSQLIGNILFLGGFQMGGLKCLRPPHRSPLHSAKFGQNMCNGVRIYKGQTNKQMRTPLNRHKRLHAGPIN